jgi:hypothetical protein
MTLLRRIPPGAWRLVAGMVALAALLGCANQAGITWPGSGPVVTVEARGGLCPAGACNSTVFLDGDGRVHSAAKPPNDLGVASAASMSALVAAITSTDFASMKARKFTGQCPAAFDGQELVFTFGTPGGSQQLASCEVAIDWGSPLFVAVAAALGQWVPLPTT